MDHDESFAPERMPPLRSRAAYVDDVRRRLEEGELDTDTALLETAHALIDGADSVGR